MSAIVTNTTVQVDGEPVGAVIRVPESGSGPGVIVVQEWWGLVPHIVDVTQRLADAGFVAMAVDHYRGAATTEPDEAEKLMLGLNIELVSHDLRVASEQLVARPDVTSEAVSVIGFCMGGGLALLAPTVAPLVRCAVAFYPAMPWPHYAPDWTRYAGRSAMIHAAESDESWAGPAIAEYSAAIVAAGGTVEQFDYPGSVHAFFNDERPDVYQDDHARLAWERTLGALRRCSS